MTTADKKSRAQKQPGVVKINLPFVGSGQVGDRFVLRHAATEQFVVLSEHAEAIWKKIEAGQSEIATLVREHAEAHNVPPEVAAYEVISFLDELRTHGFLSFRLPREHETAPVIDAAHGNKTVR
jgi:Coenzyme PQQ synthesis protein D (PqqD)